MKLLVLLTLFSSLQVYAQSDAGQLEYDVSDLSSDQGLGQRIFGRRWEIGLDTMLWDYTEYSDGRKFMNDKGMLYGARFSFQQLLNRAKSVLFKVDARLLAGQTKYDGALVDLNTGERTPHQTDSDNLIFEARPVFGWVISTPIGLAITPSAGLALRYLINPSRGRTGEYTRETTYLYAPLGLRLDYAVNDVYRLGLETRYDYLIMGFVESKLSEVGESQDISNRQDSGHGYEIAFNNFFAVGHTEFKIAPYYRVWKIKDSDIDRGFLEPENETQMLGLNAGIQF